MKKYFLYVLFLLFVCAGFAAANDSFGQVLPTGEIQLKKQDGIVLRHEALLLSDTVTVDYLFENVTDKPIEIDVFFPIPTVGPVSEYHYVPHDFKFRVWSNEKEIKPELDRKVTLDGTDVTKYFNLMGIDTYYKSIEMDPDMEKTYKEIIKPLLKLPPEEQKKLEELGMLSKECLVYENEEVSWSDPNSKDHDCEKGKADYELAKQFTIDRDSFEKSGATLPSYIDLNKKNLSPINQVVNHYNVGCRKFLPWEKKCLPGKDVYHFGPGRYYEPGDHYKQEVMYHWKQKFPPHKIVHIRHEYLPCFYDDYVGDPSGPVKKIVNWTLESGIHWYKGSYIITTANNWKTAIEKFNLLVWGESNAAVSTMGKQIPTYVRVASKNYLLDTKQDFMPKNEILFELAKDFGKKKPQIIPQLHRVDGPANVRSKPDGKKIKTLENGVYIWAYPSDREGWYAVLLDEETTGYTHKDNLIPFGK